MQRAIFLILLLAAAAAHSQESRRVLLLEYTATSCGPCAVAARAVKRLQTEAGDSLSVICVHYYDVLKIPAAESLAALYHVTTTPTAWLDGMQQELYDDTMSYWNYRWAFRKRCDNPPVLGLALGGSYDNLSRGGTISCTAGNPRDDTVQAVLRLALVERSVYFPWGGGDSVYEVLRGMVPDFSGTVCRLAPKQDTTITVPFQIDPAWDDQKMAVVAWAQDSGAHFSDSAAAVLQSARIDVPSFLGVAQRTAAVSRQDRMLTIYPNPLRREATISYQLPRAARVTAAVYNLDGQRIALLRDADQPAGEYTLAWRANDPQGRPLPQGVYFIRVSHDKTALVHTATVIH